MKIGIDCRLYGPKYTGIGRYVQNLVENLLELDKDNQYVLFTNSNNVDRITIEQLNPPNRRVTIVKADINHYSLKEQLFLPKIIKCENVDLMHFPHFNVPVFYRGKYVATIHDLIKHTSRGMETTTRSPWLYWLKYLGYKIVFGQAIKRASKIITPSQFVKGELVKQYKIDPKKVAVTYEGVDSKLKVQSAKFKVAVQSSKLLERYKITKPYLLYVGSVYPHKNIERLIEAVKQLRISKLSNCELVIVCARNVFSERLSNKIDQMKAREYVKMVGFVPDEELVVLYEEAETFVFPTLSEGFGLPGLEAMSLGCPVLCSDIPVLREVYQDSVVYFNPLEVKDIAEKIKLVMDDKKIQKRLKALGLQHAKTYSWQKTVRETLAVYQRSV